MKNQIKLIIFYLSMEIDNIQIFKNHILKHEKENIELI